MWAAVDRIKWRAIGEAYDCYRLMMIYGKLPSLCIILIVLWELGMEEVKTGV